MVADSDAVSHMLPLVFEVKAGDCPGEARSGHVLAEWKDFIGQERLAGKTPPFNWHRGGNFQHSALCELGFAQLF